jgi:hypothetical protein
MRKDIFKEKVILTEIFIKIKITKWKHLYLRDTIEFLQNPER